jgi:hypothetical protein
MAMKLVQQLQLKLSARSTTAKIEEKNGAREKGG